MAPKKPSAREQLAEYRKKRDFKRTREPSGENTGRNFSFESCVSCRGWPSGKNLTQICPRPKNELFPRMNASIRPSADRAGYTAESVKKVSCSHSLVRGGLLRDER